MSFDLGGITHVVAESNDTRCVPKETSQAVTARITGGENASQGTPEALTTIAERKARGDFPEVDPGQQASMAVEDAQEVLTWLRKIDAVQVQSFMDERYSVYRSTLPMESVDPEPVVRAKWARVSYYFLLKEFTQRKCLTPSIMEGLKSMLNLNDLASSALHTLEASVSNLDVTSAHPFFQYIDGCWQEARSKIPSFPQALEAEMKRKWFTKCCMSTVGAFFEQLHANRQEMRFLSLDGLADTPRTVLKRTGKVDYTAILASKAKPHGWTRPTLLMHFVEVTKTSTVFVVAGAAMATFQHCEIGCVYDMVIPGRCVHLNSSEDKYGIKGQFEVALKFPCSVKPSNQVCACHYDYNFVDWAVLNQQRPQSFVDVLGKVIGEPIRDANAPMDKMLVTLANGDYRQDIAFLGEQAHIRLRVNDIVAIGAAKIHEYRSERYLQTAFLTVVEINPTPCSVYTIKETVHDEGPKRKAIRMNPRALLTVQRAKQIISSMDSATKNGEDVAKQEFILHGKLLELTTTFFSEDPPLLDLRDGEVICWKTILKDETGELHVKVWDRPCNEIFRVTAAGMRFYWEEGVEDAARQTGILQAFNKYFHLNMRLLCSSEIQGGRSSRVPARVHVNVNAIEFVEA